MSKKDLIDAVAVATELPKDKAGVAVDAVIAHIEGSMKKGEEVRIPGFGTFKVTQRAARKARNPSSARFSCQLNAFEWWAVRGSNPRHPRCKRGALPLS